MAIHFIVSLSFVFFLLFLVSADGRSLQQNKTIENTDILHSFFSSNVTVRGVSLATDTYTGKTNYNDVLGLVALCTQYTWLLEANDDPCLSPKWSWIQCNSQAKPRVIELDLSSRILFGLLPDFSSMDALQKIDLSHNSLYGPIPSFLATFPALKELDLAINVFTGVIPESLACNKNLKLSIEGNTNLYTSSSCSKTNTPSSTANRNTVTNTFQSPSKASAKKKKLPAILGSTISLFVIFWIGIGIFAVFRHKAKTATAIAEASGPKANTPTEERPMNVHSNNMSP